MQSSTSCHSIVLPARALPGYCGMSWLPSHSLMVVGAWFLVLHPHWAACMNMHGCIIPSSDISTVLHSTQDPWTVALLRGSRAPALWFSFLKERHSSLSPGNISFET